MKQRHELCSSGILQEARKPEIRGTLANVQVYFGKFSLESTYYPSESITSLSA